jgi:CDGSH-type Zn-finger protein
LAAPFVPRAERELQRERQDSAANIAARCVNLTARIEPKGSRRTPRPTHPDGVHEMKIEALKNGPILIRSKGPVAFKSGASTEEKTDTVALCRCGKSATKPFCDGTHRDAGFEAEACELEIEG